ncbi:MAG: hypothetical protein E7A44_00335 [Peptoniphilus harei]|nr:hypothetical protein [Peptoniphilus harei]MDU1022348.1 hypothetical protein [Peptoniphilus harei]MDU4045679.1 hypothetical protein [Peptoniphilus harei]MDU5466587.1 hypothetical protein [Peptoniphilus harei]
MCTIINFGSVFAVEVISNEEYNPDSLSETVIYDDTKSSYRGDTFYDGITGKNLGSSSLAIMVIGSVLGDNYVNDYD